MNRFTSIPMELLEAAFDGKKLLALQILTAGFASGIILFFGVSFAVPAGAGAGSGIVPYLSIVNVFVFIICLSLSRFISRRMLIKFILAVSEGDGLRLGDTEAANAALDALRNSIIARTAILEIPALLGIVIFIISTAEGELTRNSYYAANLIPALFFLMILAMNFPTRGWAARTLTSP